MTEQSPNELFQNSSFLQGHNAQYVEQLYARYANDPHAVDESWRAFFEQMGGDAPQGPSWARPDWPPRTEHNTSRVAHSRAPSSRPGKPITHWPWARRRSSVRVTGRRRHVGRRYLWKNVNLCNLDAA